MNMEILHTEHRLCTCCMEAHDVKRVRYMDRVTYKDVPVDCLTEAFYCDLDDTFYVNEEMMSENSIRLRDTYRKKMGLLTTFEIKAIRTKYGITQTDLSVLLGWGGKTITRYESYQVQDKAHDTILKKIDSDPEWYLTLLCEVEKVLPEEAYKRYYAIASKLCENQRNQYVQQGIELAKYENAKSLLDVLPDEVIAEKIGVPLEKVQLMH